MFILHVRNQTCRACGSAETLSTLYQAEELPAPGRAHKLLPCTTIGPHDPVHKVLLPTTSTPICAKCAGDEVTRMGHDVFQRWQETLARKKTPVSAPTPNQPKEKAGSRLEDLA